MKYTVRLRAASGAGAFGEADTFDKAYLIAWEHWRSSFGTRGPHAAEVVGPEGEDFGPLKDKAILAPPAAALAEGSKRVDIEEDYLTMDSQCFFDEAKASLDDIGVMLTQSNADKHRDGKHVPLSKQSNKWLHRTRAAIVELMVELADLDYTIAEQLRERQKAARAAE